MNGYQLLAVIVQVAVCGVLAAAIWHHAKHASAVALGVSVVMLGFSLDAVRSGTLMSPEYIGTFVLAGGVLALGTLVVTAAVIRQQKVRARRQTAATATSRNVRDDQKVV